MPRREGGRRVCAPGHLTLVGEVGGLDVEGKGPWGRFLDVASPLGNASYYGRVVKACADECGGCANIAASAEELRTLENLERAYGMSGGGPAIAPLGNDADAACFGKTFPAGH